jgi:hypothetical protein
MLNMETWVTPNHFAINEFEEFRGLTPDQEFDCIGPVTVYFKADLQYKAQARKGLQQLKKLAHPLVEDRPLSEMLETQPTGLINRYNALIMAIVEDEAPGSEAFIDGQGAFGFRLPGSRTEFLNGDASGLFGFYLDAAALRQRVRDALED